MQMPSTAPTIHMILKNEKIPFDVLGHRAIYFGVGIYNELEDAPRALKPAVEEATKPDFAVENPLTRALAVKALKKHATPNEQVLVEQIAA
jgi:hypothetical protein